MQLGKCVAVGFGALSLVTSCGGKTHLDGPGAGPAGGAGGRGTSAAGASTGAAAAVAGGASTSAGGTLGAAGGATGAAGGPLRAGAPNAGGDGSGGVGSGGRGAAGGVVTSGGSSGLRDAGTVPTDAPARPSCRFVFRTTTVTAYGTYAPRNVAAIWIEDGSGKFVKTLAVWGTVMLRDLVEWTTVSDWNEVDAVTAATRPNHGPVQGTWDCTGTDRARVPDGPYQVCIAYAEDRKAIAAFYGDAATPPKELCIPFDVNGTPFDRVVPGDAYFTAVDLTMN